MAKITSYNRLSHHTLTGVGLTFSVPPSEDFTDGTWNTGGTELCLSEIGINETDNKAYVRIGNNINQFSFIGDANGNNLSQTLAVGNDSGTYSILMGTSTYIKSMNGGGQLNLDLGFAPNTVALSTDNGVLAKSYVLLDNTQALIGVPNSSIYLSNGIQIASPTASITVSSQTVSINSRIFKIASAANATAATTTLASISMSNDQTLTIQVVLNAYCASPNRNLGITMMASFLKYGGTIYQNGTTNLITKDGFGDGTTATVDTDGTNVRIRITNGAGLTTNWNASYDYLLTT